VNDLLLVDSSVARVPYVRWKVDTKYYTAHLDLHVIDVKHPDSDHKALAAQAQALVVVFDATKPAAFAEARNWATAFAAHLNPAPEIRMLIGNEGPTPPARRSASDNSAISAANRDAFDWAVDNKFEYIELRTDNDNSKVKPHPGTQQSSSTSTVATH
jgi:hypothetical protein